MSSDHAKHTFRSPRYSTSTPVQYWLVLVLLLSTANGCAWLNRRQTNHFAPPQVFQNGDPTLPQIMERVNQSLNISRLQSDSLTVSGPELPARLSGHLKWERPHNFRLEAEVPFFGTALAAGSNSEMFWLQTQMPGPPRLYYARHDSFSQQQGPRTILPVSPLWLREAMGVVELDPAMPHQGPILRPDGRLEVRTIIATGNNSFRRDIVVNRHTGVIEETLLRDGSGKLVAQARQSNHQYKSGIDFSMPHKADIQLLPDEGPPITFTVEVGFYLINENNGAIDNFALPNTRGLTAIDLTLLNSQTVPLGQAPAPNVGIPNGRNQGLPRVPAGPAAFQRSPAYGGAAYSQPLSPLTQANANIPTHPAVQPPTYTASQPPAGERFDFNRFRR